MKNITENTQTSEQPSTMRELTATELQHVSGGFGAYIKFFLGKRPGPG